jgi:hypothetical protein
MRKSLIAAAVCAAAVALVGAGSAFAGEITGNGKPLWTSTIVDPVTGEVVGHTLHANSICAFSGQEDLQFVDEQGNLLANPTKGQPGHSQSWGQLVSAGFVAPSVLKGGDPSPGTSCNGHRGYLAGGGSE